MVAEVTLILCRLQGVLIDSVYTLEAGGADDFWKVIVYVNLMGVKNYLVVERKIRDVYLRLCRGICGF